MNIQILKLGSFGSFYNRSSGCMQD